MKNPLIIFFFLVFASITIKSQVMTVESTKKVMNQYLISQHSDASMMAEDVVFTNMATGDQYHSPEGVLQMLNYIYHIAFDAKAELKNSLFDEGRAVFEGDFVGKHIGEFAGIPATNKNVRVPLCVVYDLENEKIKTARIYFEMPVLLQQLNEIPLTD